MKKLEQKHDELLSKEGIFRSVEGSWFVCVEWGKRTGFAFCAKCDCIVLAKGEDG